MQSRERRIIWDRRQAADAQLARYYCSAQSYTEVAHIDIAGPGGPKYPYYWGGEGGKVSRLKSKRIHSHESDSTTHRDWYTISKNKKSLVWEVKSAWQFWTSTVVSHPWYCSHLAGSCWIMAEKTQKKTRTKENNNNNNNNNNNGNNVKTLGSVTCQICG